jgi:hypothetical protein
MVFRRTAGNCSASPLLTGEKWLVPRDGEPGMSYVSQKGAYEVAVAEAAGDLRTGREIRIEVVGSAFARAGDGSRYALADNMPRNGPAR